jgi:hypothetical protein
MRKLGCKSTGVEDYRYVRSLTILAQDASSPNLASTAASLSIAGLWGTDELQAETGRYLLILPTVDDKRRSSKTSTVFVDLLNDLLARISMNVLGVSNAIKPVSTDYEHFLESVFYRRSPDNNLTLLESRFDSWWIGHSEGGSCDSHESFPQYRAYSTIALGCDGLSIHDPDTLMIFSSQAVPPEIVETAGEELANVCRRLSILESDVLIESQAAARAEMQERNRQHRAMVASFGHDGKRPANTIELLLRSQSKLAARVAQMLSRSLVLRLEAFSSLLNTPASNEDARARLRRERARAQSWYPIQAIWEEEVLSLLVRILIDGSGFRIIRESVFGKDSKLDNFEMQFSPMLDILSKPESSDSQERIEAVRETLRLFTCLKPTFSALYDDNGLGLCVPYALHGEGGEIRVPLAMTSISFLISEMLANNAKHQWPSLAPKLENDGIHLKLLLTQAGDGFDIELLSKPAMKTSPSSNLIGEDRTITGLTSVRMVAAGLGAHFDCQHIYVNGEPKGEFPFPLNRRWCFDGIEEVWSTYSLRGVEIKE